MEVVSLAAGELPAFVQLAQRLDDGEAATLAAARARGWGVLTDDRKATSVAAELQVPVLSTAGLPRRLADHRRLDEEAVRRMLVDVERRSSFRPRASDVDADWWRGVRRGQERDRPDQAH